MATSKPQAFRDTEGKSPSEPRKFPDEPLPRTIGRYQLLRRIARGGMGEVFLATTTGLEGAERPVVVKIIRRDHAKDPSFIARFLDEARVQAQLQHSGVAQVIEAATCEASGEPYAVVEHVEGRSLGDVRAKALQIGKALGWSDAVAIAALIAEALAHVHERLDASGRALSIVHRDLSPQNVMVSFGGDVKIIDFGTARGQNRRCHTVSGVVFAKPGYVAPEVANGDSGDARVDVYALGVMLWELCAGRRFLQGDANDHLAAVARNARNLPKIAESVGAPAELDALITKMTAFDRDERYGRSRTAASDLANLLAASPSLASGERGVRARTAELMRALFPGEPSASRREFQKLVYAAREGRSTTATPQMAAAPALARIEADHKEGLLPGTRYRLKREIGRGASSIVYEAEHVDLGRAVAIKALSPEQSRSAEFAERFRREARALSHLSHENLLAIHDCGLAADGRLFCVMDLLEGETLEAYLMREKGMDWREALDIVDKALLALEVAHGANVVHRDIKPANLFLCDPFGTKLLDFGLAKTGAPGGGEESARRGGFTLLGTPEYMAPEQASAGQVDARADLYALGSVVYEMLTGRLPFVGKSSVAILDAKIHGSPERPRDRVPARGIPLIVDELVMKALARHPSERFQTATAMRRAIATALAVPEKRRNTRRLVGFSALASVLAFAGVLGAAKAREITSASAWFRGAPAPRLAAVHATDGSEPVPFDPNAGMTNPDDSWARAERGEDPLPEEAASEPEAPEATAAAEVPIEAPALPEPEAAPERKPRAKKRRHAEKPKAVARAEAPAVEPSVDDVPEGAKPAADASAEPKAAKVKPRRKKKSRVAHVE